MGNTLNKMRTGTVRPTNGIDIAEFIYSDLAEKVVFMYYSFNPF